MKISEIVYYCLDAIKAFSDDAYVNEDHIKFLLGKYRGALLKQYDSVKKYIPESNFQTVCLTLKPTKQIPCTTGPILKSVEELPTLIPVSNPTIMLYNGMDSENIVFVPFARLKFVGRNKWKQNFIYASVGPDRHLYLNSTNPQASYLSSLRLKGLFEDYEKAAEMTCDGDTVCDIMEAEFPLEVSLVPNLISVVVRDALGVLYRSSDPKNNAVDDLADIAAFVRQNMKNKYQRQLEGDE